MNQQTLELSDWQIATVIPATAPSGIAESAWRKALVPGIASQSLAELAERIDELEIWYRCPWPAAYPASYLVCEGYAGVIEVYADQQLLELSDSMFTRHQLALPEFSQPPAYLYLRCLPMQAMLADKKPRPRWKTRLVSQQGWRWHRQSLLGRMPGWSYSHAPVGPFRPLHLVSAQALHCLDWQATCQLEGQHGRIVLRARLALPANSWVEMLDHWHFRVRSKLAEAALSFTLHEFAGRRELLLQGELKLGQVELWWPHTHGQAVRYPLQLHLLENDQSVWHEDLGYCAFRQVSWPNSPGLALHINQVPVFCRGACWTPLPGLSDDISALRQSLELVRAAGMNMLRIPGTMMYESQNFYALCDELGIMVWQDCVMANLDYPLQDASFAHNVKQEIAEFLTHRRHYASLVVICGNSEIEQQAAMLGLARDSWRHAFFQNELPALISEMALNCFYTPSSPASSSDTAWPFQANAGISHYFGVGAYLRPLSDARYAEIKFTSEALGFANLPDEVFLERHFTADQVCSTHPHWKRGIPRDQACHWDFEDVRDTYLQQIFQVQPTQLRSSDNYRYRQLSRLSSGIAMAHCLQEWRRLASPCQGALIWFWRDLVPGAGWGLLDADGQPKAAYYLLKRVLQARAVWLSDEGINGLQCHLANDSATTLHARLVVSVWRNGAQRQHQSEQLLSVPPHSQQSFNDAQFCPQFMDISYAYRFGPAQHQAVHVALYAIDDSTHLISDALFLPEGWSKLPQQMQVDWQIQLSALPEQPGNWHLQLQCNQLAIAVALEIPGFVADDNYFDLIPGQVRRLQLRAITPQADHNRLIPRGQLQALNAASPWRLPEPELK